MWALADSIFGETTPFHLVGHDHGAALGWVTAGRASERNHPGRLQSYIGLSVPHPDAFNSGLVGPFADKSQQVASSYFIEFSLPDSATTNGEALSELFRYGGFDNAEGFQKALWWYLGADYFARPPYLPNRDLRRAGVTGIFPLAVRRAVDLSGVYPEDDEGEGAKMDAGLVDVPSMFICGSKDMALLCDRDYALRTSEYVTGNYTYLRESCGHNLMTTGIANGCTTRRALDRVFDGITSHIFAFDRGR